MSGKRSISLRKLLELNLLDPVLYCKAYLRQLIDTSEQFKNNNNYLTLVYVVANRTISLVYELYLCIMMDNMNLVGNYFFFFFNLILTLLITWRLFYYWLVFYGWESQRRITLLSWRWVFLIRMLKSSWICDIFIHWGVLRFDLLDNNIIVMLYRFPSLPLVLRASRYHVQLLCIM